MSMTPMQRAFYGESKRVRNDRIKRDLGVSLLYPDYPQGLAALLRQWRAGTGGQAEAAQETTAPVEQRLGTLP